MLRSKREGVGMPGGRMGPEQGTQASEPASRQPKVSVRLADQVPSSPIVALQSKVGNLAVSRLVRSLPPPSELNVVARSPTSDLIDEHTSWNNLDEEALGRVLLIRARSGDYRFVQDALDELGRTDRDDVSKEFTAAARVADLEAMVATAPGRALVDRLYDELTGGSVASEEQALADRLLNVKTARMDPRAYAAAMTSKTTKVFPYRLPGFTVLDDAAVLAERRPEGRIWVRQMARVWGTPMFKAETATLPVDLFTSRGIELPEDEIVGVRMYDLGGVLVYRPALILVSLANESLTTNLTKIAEIAGIGLTLGTGALAGLGVEATVAARIGLSVDRAVFALSVLMMVIKEHRGEILAQYGEGGQEFLNRVDYISNATAVYGFARVALTMPSLAAGLRGAYVKLRDTGSGGSIDALATEIEALLKNADEIEDARTAATPAAQEGGARSVPDGPAPSPTWAPRQGPDAKPNPGGHGASGAGAAKPVQDPHRQGVSLSEIFGEDYDFRVTDGMRDPIKHSNIVLLRRLALKSMQASGPNQPVKVVPLNYKPSTSVNGDFTLAKFVNGRTPEQLANELGVKAFAKGVRVYRLDPVGLNEANLNLRGLTQSPGGKAPHLSTLENLEMWPKGQGSVQYNTEAAIPVTSSLEIPVGQRVRLE